MARGGCQGEAHDPPPASPPHPPTHVLQWQPQAVAQDTPQVPDLRPHGAPHVLVLQRQSGSGGCGCPQPHGTSATTWGRPQFPSAHPTWDPTHQAEPGARAVGPGLGRARGLGAR